ncbi:MAG TPA: acyl-ACP--UDP-N-acetylglucosamine O-acyltransferase [Armatimonadota bacterium]|jgi:UDP-N-acetylglucosamine acyltransferase
MIHPSAIIDPGAQLADDVEVGPGVIIGPDTVIGSGVVIGPHVVIKQYTEIGENCTVESGSVLGGVPQDFKFHGERSFLKIGANNKIREFVTIHRASGEERSTVIGDNNMIMAYCHIGHNCDLGNNITMANMVGISGHVVVEDRVVFGGMVGVHQFVRFGKLAMVGGFSKVVQDVPPFMMADGRPTRVYGLNVLGLRRAGVQTTVRSGLKQAYKFIYRSDMNLSQAIEAIEAEVESSTERDYLLEFLHNVRLGFGGRQLDPNRPKNQE